uniref:Lsm14-like N-terminal domain-containing protein n=1 Tax=Laticauda laticaudata TaxID=8630 RepID=A0A8C5S7B9_LATLA
MLVHHPFDCFAAITGIMATDWLGSIVSISCGDSLGVYQGRVSAVNQASQTISLTRPFHNGVKCLVPEVTFRVVQ